MTLAEQLVEIAQRPKGDADLSRAALHLMDWLGCIAAAQASPAGQAALRYGGWADLGVGFAQAQRADDLAFVTGALGNVLEMDDLHRASLLHVGDVVCPAALAAALAQSASGPALLAALVSGYEVAIRIGRAAAAQGYAPWYNSATCGVFGAAMAAAEIAGLAQPAEALAQAGMGASGIWQCRLDPGTGKQLATALAARNGVAAADLVRAGFTGPRHILEGDLGFFATYYPEAALAEVSARPDAPFALHEVSFKPYPACRHTHAAIAAALELPGPDPQRVEVMTYGAALAFCDAPAPDTAHGARFSLQHCVAVALARGAPKLADFDTEARQDPVLSALRDRISLREDPQMTAAFPRRMGARVTLWDRDGQAHVLHRGTAPGDPEDPLSPTTLREKVLRNLTHGGASEEAAHALIAACTALPEARDLTDLRAALRRALSPQTAPIGARDAALL
ncbi:MmgE/PrpD family protein [Dinoroseobacter sp. S76]|uniref:MmgE/PrpD family protein n=1 Tax=Dinoroseobacter sp. S76 TaxID=3415124 RepID=UPI003C79A742